jgi:hypothetical protein
MRNALAHLALFDPLLVLCTPWLTMVVCPSETMSQPAVVICLADVPCCSMCRTIARRLAPSEGMLEHAAGFCHSQPCHFVACQHVMRWRAVMLILLV